MKFKFMILTGVLAGVVLLAVSAYSQTVKVGAYNSTQSGRFTTLKILSQLFYSTCASGIVHQAGELPCVP